MRVSKSWFKGDRKTEKTTQYDTEKYESCESDANDSVQSSTKTKWTAFKKICINDGKSCVLTKHYTNNRKKVIRANYSLFSLVSKCHSSSHLYFCSSLYYLNVSFFIGGILTMIQIFSYFSVMDRTYAWFHYLHIFSIGTKNGSVSDFYIICL